MNESSSRRIAGSRAHGARPKGTETEQSTAITDDHHIGVRRCSIPSKSLKLSSNRKTLPQYGTNPIPKTNIPPKSSCSAALLVRRSNRTPILFNCRQYCAAL